MTSVTNSKSPWRQYQAVEKKRERPGAPVQTPARRVHCEPCFIRERVFRDAALRIDGRALCLGCVRDEELDPADGEVIDQPPTTTPAVLVHDATRERRAPGLLNTIQRAATDAADKVSAPANGAKQESTMEKKTCAQCGEPLRKNSRDAYHPRCRPKEDSADGGATSVSAPKAKRRGGKKPAVAKPARATGNVLLERLVEAWWGGLAVEDRAAICERELA